VLLGCRITAELFSVGIFNVARLPVARALYRGYTDVGIFAPSSSLSTTVTTDCSGEVFNKDCCEE